MNLKMSVKIWSMLVDWLNVTIATDDDNTTDNYQLTKRNRLTTYATIYFMTVSYHK